MSQQTLQRAIVLHQSGNLPEAERIYRAILAADPAQFDALHYLGVLEWQRGRLREADALLDRARRVKPASAEACANHASVLHAMGRHAEALATCEQALSRKPSVAETLHLRGVILQSLARNADALASYDAALALKPGFPEALGARGTVLRALQRNDEALLSCEQMVALQPQSADAHHNLGLVQQALRKSAQALASYERALALRPGFVAALVNRGVTLADLHRPREALASYEAALACEPDLVVALVNRGTVLTELRYYDQAVASLTRALALAPGFPEALISRAAALTHLKRYGEALADCEGALVVRPDSADAWHNRAAALLGLTRFEEALASCDSALALRPDFAGALNNRGNALTALGRTDDALASFDRALRLEPDLAEGRNNRGACLTVLERHAEAAAEYARALEIAPALPFVAGALLHARMHCCDWSGLDDAARGLVADVRSGKESIAPFPLLAIAGDARDQLLCARTWVRERYPQASTPLWRGERYAHDRIRVAYLSSDFHDHATAYLAAGLFEHHDRRRFETVAVSFGATTTGAMRERLERAFDHFVDARRMSDSDVARQLRAMEIDIAVDLKGFTQGARTGILALRPAPMQVSYLGYPGTMGAPYIDYILADEIVIPPNQRGDFDEQVVYLPGSYQVNDATRGIAARTPSRAEEGLPESGFVFCSFNNNYKITPLLFDAWMRLLGNVPGSVLWLLAGNDAAPANLRREAAARGIASGRLVFAPRREHADHLARHRLADLFLDTLPVNAHTTASDALWAGLPLLTCRGTTFAGRVAASVLHAIGLPELVTGSLGEYESRALQLATDATLLADIRQRLANNRRVCPLFDTLRSCRHIEAAYTQMRSRHRRGEPPSSFAVAAIA